MQLLIAPPKQTESPQSTFDAIEALLNQCQLGSMASDRREAARLPLSQEICFIGLDDHFQASTTPVLMEGRDVSAQGLSFSHRSPLSTRFAAVSFRSAAGIETIIAKLTWCRFSRPGCYVSGGKFVRMASTIDVPQDWSALQRD